MFFIMAAAVDVNTRTVMYKADDMEVFRLDLMSMESRLGGYVKEHADRVVAALNRHGAKLDELGAAAVAAANSAKEAVAVAANTSVKAAPTPSYEDWVYWWGWWRASWNTPLSLFFLGFAMYQAESRVHTVIFYTMGAFFSPYLAGVALVIVLFRYTAAGCRSLKRRVQRTPCGRCCCPRSDADLARDAELGDLSPARPVGVRMGAAAAHSTMLESALETTTAPLGFWSYARGWLNPLWQYSPISARTSFTVWYVLGLPVKIRHNGISLISFMDYYTRIRSVNNEGHLMSGRCLWHTSATCAFGLAFIWGWRPSTPGTP
jgi:hypothetical protein